MTTLHRTRGDDWTLTGTVSSAGTPVDLTGATVTAQLRTWTEAATVAATFDVTVLDAADGRLSLSLDADVTATLAPRAYVYDLEVTLDGATTTYGNGSIIEVTADTTRAVA